MAVVLSSVATAFASTTNTNSYSFASWTPEATTEYLAAVLVSHGTAAAVLNSLTGNTITWVAVTGGMILQADSTRRLTLMRGTSGASPTTGTTVANFTGTHTGCIIHMIKIAGGAGGASAFGTPVTGDWVSTANPSITVSSFGGPAGSATFGWFHTGNSDPAVGSGFSVLDESTYATPNVFGIGEWIASQTSPVNVTAGAASGIGIAVEIIAVSSGTNAAAGHASGTGTAL